MKGNNFLGWWSYTTAGQVNSGDTEFMSLKFYKIRLGHSKRGSNITRRAQIADPCICRQENTCLSPKDSLTHQVLWANWLTLLNTEASLSSWPVTLFCRTGQPYQILDKHRLCHARTWSFFLYSKLVTFRVMISSAVHGYQYAKVLTQTHLNIPFNLIFSFPKKNMPDINKQMLRLCKRLSFINIFIINKVTLIWPVKC